MTDHRALAPHEDPPAGLAVVLDLDELRLTRPVGSSRLARLGARQAEDTGRTVRLHALDRVTRR